MAEINTYEKEQADLPTRLEEKKIETTTTSAIPIEEEEAQSFYKRVGYFSLAVLGLSLFVVFACISFLSFLWYGNAGNSTWHRIMVNEWATRAISLTTTALRWAIATQSAVALAMLAALALERFHVPLAHMADVSLMRVNGSPILPTLLDVCWPLFRFGPPGVLLRTVLPILILLATSVLVQFSSTVLLSDLYTDQIPGYPVHSNVSLDWFFDGTFFRYVPTTSKVVWGGNKPPFWPAFGELSGPAFEREGLSDTGMNIRAFLPYLTAEARQSVHKYNGKAMLLDSRVTCQKPILEDIGMYTESPKGEWSVTNQPVVTGKASPSFLDTPRFNASDRPTPFDCPVSMIRPESFAICELKNVKARSPADAGLEQWEYPGTLISEFRHYPPLSPYQDVSGAAYLIVTYNNSNVPFGNGEWTTLEIETPGQEFRDFSVTQNISATLCYTALDPVLRNVEVFSDMNRTEPSLSYDPEAKAFNWLELYRQLLAGPSNDLTIEERGVLNLALPVDTWVADESLDPGYDGPWKHYTTGSIYQSQYPYITEAVHLWPVGESRWPYGNYSAILDPTYWGWSAQYGAWPQVGASSWIISLFEDMIYKQNGTVANTLQMILFSLSGMAYYDQLPQYNNFAEVDTEAFVAVLHPGGPFGTTRTKLPVGFTAVMVVTAVHVLAFFYVCWMFAYKAKFSRLGDTWMAIANVVDATLTDGILEVARQVRAGRSDASAAASASETEARRNINVGLTVINGQVHLKTL